MDLRYNVPSGSQRDVSIQKGSMFVIQLYTKYGQREVSQHIYMQILSPIVRLGSKAARIRYFYILFIICLHQYWR
jgi:hypothetical protein